MTLKVLNIAVLILVLSYSFTIVRKNEKNMVIMSICQFVICSVVILLSTIIMFYNMNKGGISLINILMIAIQVFQIFLTNRTLKRHKKEQQVKCMKDKISKNEIVV